MPLTPPSYSPAFGVSNAHYGISSFLPSLSPVPPAHSFLSSRWYSAHPHLRLLSPILALLSPILACLTVSPTSIPSCCSHLQIKSLCPSFFHIQSICQVSSAVPLSFTVSPSFPLTFTVSQSTFTISPSESIRTAHLHSKSIWPS